MRTVKTEQEKAQEEMRKQLFFTAQHTRSKYMRAMCGSDVKAKNGLRRALQAAEQGIKSERLWEEYLAWRTNELPHEWAKYIEWVHEND